MDIWPHSYGIPPGMIVALLGAGASREAVVGGTVQGMQNIYSYQPILNTGLLDVTHRKRAKVGV